MSEHVQPLEATRSAGVSSGTKKVIFASSLGTVFEWYDFFLYGALAAVISKQFFAGVNDTTAFIFALMAFAAGFIVRPFGALVFGRLGDMIGRKYTFENHPLEPLDNIVRQTALTNLIKPHNSSLHDPGSSPGSLFWPIGAVAAPTRRRLSEQIRCVLHRLFDKSFRAAN